MAIRFGDLFDRVAAGCAESIREVELFGDFGYWKFAIGIVDYIDADRSETDGCGH